MNILARVSTQKVMLGIGLCAIVCFGIVPAFLSTARAADTLAGSVTVSVVVKGGTANSSNFVIHIKKYGTSSGNVSGSGSTVTFSSLVPGMYVLSQTGGPSGYSGAWSGSCNAQGNVTIAANVTANCTLTNIYGAKPPTGGGGGTSGRERPPVVRPGR